MAHQISIVNGRAEAAYKNTPAWHCLGRGLNKNGKPFRWPRNWPEYKGWIPGAARTQRPGGAEPKKIEINSHAANRVSRSRNHHENRQS